MPPGTSLKGPQDQAFAFDYDRSGKLDHLALHRPGSGAFYILRNDAGAFVPVYARGDPGAGIGGYDLKGPQDQAFAFDYDSSGKLDRLALYRPGTGTMWILTNNGGAFVPVYAQGDPGAGIGGYDLKGPQDQAFAFDYEHTKRLDHLVICRGGAGKLWILEPDATHVAVKFRTHEVLVPPSVKVVKSAWNEATVEARTFMEEFSRINLERQISG